MNSDYSSADTAILSANEDQAHSNNFAFAERVELRLAELGRDWAWLSRKTGISTSALSDMRKHGRIPRADRAIKMAKVLELDFEYLATGDRVSRDTLVARAADQSPFEAELVSLVKNLSARERAAILSMVRLLAGDREPDPVGRRGSLHSPPLDYSPEGR